jgi:Tfp pilus assembly ATPase PilU
MQTLEQAMLDLVRHGKITTDVALNRSSRPDQLKGLLQRYGLLVEAEAGNLRVAGG